MAHLVGKDIYRELGRKLDGMEMRTPWNDTLRAILTELYTAEAAEILVRMPNGLSTFAEIERATGVKETALRRLLDALTAKGLVVDLWVQGEYRYAPSPMVVGIFEFTMMRMGPNAKSKEWARLFHEYLSVDGSFLEANFGRGERFSFIRALPYEETIEDQEHVEVLDYEKASSLIAEADTFSVGLCSCRHEKLHLGEKRCAAPLESCTQFGYAADFMIRNQLAREVDRSEMEELFARSRELGLVLAADNVQKGMKFVCHCCGCCCNVLLAVSRYGYPNAIVTSSYRAEIGEEECIGCGRCVKACPIAAIATDPAESPQAEGARPKVPVVDGALCLGCGVCALKCHTGACRLAPRGQRVIPPETTFERVMLQCLEKGTLQNQLFADPQGIGEKFLRAFVGAFLNLTPVRQALLSDRLRSRFLQVMREGARKQGKGWVLEL